DECTFSCERSHNRNSAIQFYNPLTQVHDTGFIQQIWRLLLEGTVHIFINVCPHQQLSEQQEGQAPFKYYPGFMTWIVDAIPSNTNIINEPAHIITNVVTFQHPVGTYNIGREVLVVCWAANRGHR
ncbi:hypothetical protein L208DRAFT_1328977, partial [Tricholoma matsutake]